MIFRGSVAVSMGDVTHAQLRGPRFVALFRDVYTDSRSTITHEVRCRGASLIMPPDAMITGRSAATIRGSALARPYDPVEVVVPLDRRITRRVGVDLRRTDLAREDCEPWGCTQLANPLRMGLDLALDRPLPDAVGDLDVVLRAGLLDRDELLAYVIGRSERGIVRARRAVQLTDPLAESPPESKMRVWLVLAGLQPVSQHWIEDGSGPIARVDLAFTKQRLAVEYDGQWRDGQSWALNHDRERLNRVHAAGWDTVFVTNELLAKPRKMVYTVQAALRSCTY